MKACVNCEANGDDCFDPSINTALKPRDQWSAKKKQVPENYVKRVIQFAARATPRSTSLLRHRWDSEAYLTGLGPELQQFSLAQGRLPARRRGRWQLEPDRPQGRPRLMKTLKARDLWEKIGHAPGRPPIPASTSTRP